MNPRFEIFRSATFDQWLSGLRNRQARTRVHARIDRLRSGNSGDARSVGDGVSELRIDHGPGYRVYFMRRGVDAVVLLCGGDKRTQPRDIERAMTIAQDWRG
ncbi:MAG TPA: type II toxin-antitoxin system RelE/ParE family toxin [Steroidobacter sp.]|uniref:type II toxin-antitoxin system RelE/ParE family toxin n=1 Tax=Steroidobacter sp. TaxID=1978227 RepID=UPI002ED8FEC2